jgi:hypothetical protein
VTRYRYPRLSDPTLDALLLGVATLTAIISAALAPPPWRYLLIVLALACAAGTAVQLRRRYSPTQGWRTARYVEQTTREAILRDHFAVTPEEYRVACNYCDWSTQDYAYRLVHAPKHLHDEHPQHDPRIPSWLRQRWTAWLGRLVTEG